MREIILKEKLIAAVITLNSPVIPCVYVLTRKAQRLDGQCGTEGNNYGWENVKIVPVEVQ